MTVWMGPSALTLYYRTTSETNHIVYFCRDWKRTHRGNELRIKFLHGVATGTMDPP